MIPARPTEISIQKESMSFDPKHPQLNQNWLASVSDHRLSIDNKDSKTPLLNQKPRPGAVAWEIEESVATNSLKPVKQGSRESAGVAWEIQKESIGARGLISGAVAGMDKN